MQKTRSILFLRQVLDQLDQDQDTDLARSVSFREKDLTILQDECENKYKKLMELITEKQRLDERLFQLKEQLCDLNPEALEEIERDCEQKNNGASEQLVGKEKGVGSASKQIKKKGDKKKKRKERLYYD